MPDYDDDMKSFSYLHLFPYSLAATYLVLAPYIEEHKKRDVMSEKTTWR
jgi:hypothetical protein